MEQPIRDYIKILEATQKRLLKMNGTLLRKIFIAKEKAGLCQNDDCYEAVYVEGTDFCKKHYEEAQAGIEDREDPFEKMKPRMGYGRAA